MLTAVMWLQNNLGVDVTGEWVRHVHLNVGGVLYTTRRHTLRGLREHPVFGPILAGRAHKCEDGSFLLDGDGALFRYVLDFLRHGSLTVPDNFHEWEMLLREARHYQLAALEQAVLDRFEYQRSVFARQLPHGVYVWWPTTVVEATPMPLTTGTSVSVDGRGAAGTARSPPLTAAASSGVGSPQPPPVSQGFPSAAAPETTQAATDKAHSPPNLHTAGTAPPRSRVPSTSPDFSSPPASAFPGGSRHTSVRIVPPLPGLKVDAASGAFVTFHDSQVLQDLDQLVTILLSVYGYTIQHWDDARGRVLLTLPGAL